MCAHARARAIRTPCQRSACIHTNGPHLRECVSAVCSCARMRALVLTPCRRSVCTQAGIIGSFPALNARPKELLDEWLTKIKADLAEHTAAHPDRPAAPFAVPQTANPNREPQRLPLLSPSPNSVPNSSPTPAIPQRQPQPSPGQPDRAREVPNSSPTLTYNPEPNVPLTRSTRSCTEATSVSCTTSSFASSTRC